MEQIAQLKAMRDAAKARLMTSPDWKLMVALDALIPDLEKAFGVSGASEPEAGEEAEAADEEPASETGPEPDIPIAPFVAQEEIEETRPEAPEPLQQPEEEPDEVEVLFEEHLLVEESIAVTGEEEAGSQAGALTGQQEDSAETADEGEPRNASDDRDIDLDLDLEFELESELDPEDAVNRALDELKIDLSDVELDEQDRRPVYPERN